MPPREGSTLKTSQRHHHRRRQSIKERSATPNDPFAEGATDGDSSASWNGSYASVGSATSLKSSSAQENTLISLLDPSCVLASESEALAECLDSLTDRRRWLREAALRRARRLTDSGLRMDLWNETLLEQLIEQALRGPLRRGSLSERREVCRLIGTSTLTLVAINDQTETIEALLQRTRLEAVLLQSASEASSTAADPEWIQWQECLVETVCLLRFLTAADAAAVGDTMQQLERYFVDESPTGLEIEREQLWTNDQVVAAAIRGWALLASALPPSQVWLRLNRRPIRQSLEFWAIRDDWKKTSTPRETCLAATEAIALLLEHCHGVEADALDEQHSSDQQEARFAVGSAYSSAASSSSTETSLSADVTVAADDSVTSVARPPGVPQRTLSSSSSSSSSTGLANLGKALEKVASTAERHRHRLGKRNRSLLRLVTRSATQRIGADTISLRQRQRHERIEASSWTQRRQLDALRRACGCALAPQLEGNAYLRDLFGLDVHGTATPATLDASSSDLDGGNPQASGIHSPKRNRRPGIRPEQVRRQARQQARRQKQQRQQLSGLEP